MKAAVRSKYGSGEVLSIQEIDKPTPRDNEVMIRVYAASANRSDLHVLTGKPLFMRLFTGLFKPKLAVTGSDFAGQVEATGPAVTSFKAGDKVMGFGGGLGTGTHAQYVTFAETKRIVLMPGNINYKQAAACLEGTYYAAMGIHQLKLTAGQKALVYGATGAIGSAYVQFLKYYGVYVTAVCGGENRELVRSWGADKMIDYKKEDFTKDNEQYDFVIDAVGKSSFAKCKRLLKKKGIYAPSGGAENIFLVLINPLLGGKKVLFPKDNKGNLSFIKDLLEKGNFKPVIDRVYPLEKISEAFTYVATGQKIGNVIVTMD
ncbi:MAG TPA: NAD(P)-dependent alcohol dehydrogenase [Chitinophagaceae bacterium]|nr:NAD(P)-dependent alcohol dehydrogenase [Chitinophagaceae bacterium]